MIKTCDENNDTHVDVLLRENLSKACNLFLYLGMLFLKLAQILEKVRNKFIDKDSARWNEYEKNILYYL